uniref:Uncharacterized protein n=1 Tax=Gossypium raimondii TaxID=29730 RepID=A0A0D2V6G7_GOSRA|nr:hypothetical protein B456_012G172800 [Gossypium raimondii]
MAAITAQLASFKFFSSLLNDRKCSRFCCQIKSFENQHSNWSVEFLSGKESIVCNKVRIGDQRIVRIKEGDATGRHVVIVDDLVQSGGTLIECQKVLAANGATKISAYVTHGTFPKSSWQRFEHDNGGQTEKGLTYFWITDSCPHTVKEVKCKRPFEILSLSGSIAAALQV